MNCLIKTDKKMWRSRSEADRFAKLERDLADPDNRKPHVQYARALRSMTAKVSLGRVSATVNGFGILKRVRIAPEMYSDPARLGRLVVRAINLAKHESWRRQPVPSSVSGDDRIVAPPPTPAHLGGALTAADRACWRGLTVPGENEVQHNAFIDAAHVVRERILRDAERLPSNLAPLLRVVHQRLGEVRLGARTVRRAAGIDDPTWSKRFQRAAGVSLTDYIQQRQAEIAARMTYRSDLTLEEIAGTFGYLNRTAITNVIRWNACRRSPEELRFFWEVGGIDCILLEWATEGIATTEQAQQVVADLDRLALRIRHAHL